MDILEAIPQNGTVVVQTAALPSFTFPDSGITVRLRRFAPDTIAQIGRAIKKDLPPPSAPLQEVDYGEGKRLEPNEGDPTYLKALAEYESEITTELGERLLRLVVRRVEVVIDVDAVQQLREDMEAIGASLADMDDKSIYVRHICIASRADMEALSSHILRLSQPTGAAVQEHIDIFRGDI